MPCSPELRACSGNLLQQLGRSCIYSRRCSLFHGFLKHRGPQKAQLCYFWYGSAWPRTSRPCLGSKSTGASSGVGCERPAGRDLSLWRLSRCARAHSPGTLGLTDANLDASAWYRINARCNTELYRNRKTRRPVVFRILGQWKVSDTLTLAFPQLTHLILSMSCRRRRQKIYITGTPFLKNRNESKTCACKVYSDIEKKKHINVLQTCKTDKNMFI